MRQIVEPLAEGMRRQWDVSEVLAERDTPYQHLLIGRTAQGIALFCDDERQSTDASQLVYHEALLIPAMLLSEQIRRVLIIGSSEGVLSQLSASAGAELIEHVDIDRETVQACAAHLPYGYSTTELAGAETGNGPIRMRYHDGDSFLAEAADRGERYDIVVIDLPDENADADAQHNRLYEEDFLRRCTNVLAPGGVLACQAGCPTLWRNDTLHAAWRRFNDLFGTVVYFGSDEHEWAFLSGRLDHLDDPAGVMVARLSTTKYRPATLDAQTIRGSTVPPYSLRR